MLFESTRIRDWLNGTILQTPLGSSDEAWQLPRSQRVSLNPMPALIIMLLGMMMGSHHQDSMTSTMVHKQWGNMLVGFALARGMTYVLLFLKPPTSYLPARPPTEIIASFCLISGGLIFMMSVSAQTLHSRLTRIPILTATDSQCDRSNGVLQDRRNVHLHRRPRLQRLRHGLRDPMHCPQGLGREAYPAPTAYLPLPVNNLHWFPFDTPITLRFCSFVRDIWSPCV